MNSFVPKIPWQVCLNARVIRFVSVHPLLYNYYRFQRELQALSKKEALLEKGGIVFDLPDF
jgi:hypothetical protein